MRTERTRRIALAALVLPSLALATLAARSYRPFGAGNGSDRAASSTFLDSLFTVVAVLAVAVTVALFTMWLYLRKARALANRGGGWSLGGLVAYLVVVLLVVAMGRALLHQHLPARQDGGTEAGFPQQPGKQRRPQPGVELGRSPRVVWPLAGGLAGLIAAAAVAAAVVVARRRRRVGPEPDEALEELRSALDDAIDDLRREPDPRRAVVAAYARMEGALSAYGLPRASSETPYEYLARIARELRAEGSVAALTDLFEEAKFSEHAVGEPMRERAIDALCAVRAEVQAGTA